ncbi:LLM class flavin-dependent oxidoreductase [Mycobacterium yunnanensis]|uniref:LLM class flavin-dependent oxidoreductase n=1 Tax=Mycobacterium yunnanensis TaxID=368477 RepID=A0A9X2Z0L6_9MYCO|nr:LLM class flavin-dependent oxidoreductase [Mycobacterium yunnanensis]MCV7421765.1 LLM class flavin-dependent oxidoreductase [Mycobacterium yunnanensis]
MASSLSVGVEVTGDGVGATADTPASGVRGLARRLDSADVSYWVIGAERAEVDGASASSLDPTLVATTAARHSVRLGLVVAAAPHRDHPYNLARRLVSVDHAAHGRAGWLALDRDRTIAQNVDVDAWTGSDLGAEHTADAIAAVRTLWRTWPLQSVVGNLASGVFADASQIRRADVTRGYSITGPLNVPGSVQGDLPVWQQWPQGGESGGEDADLVIVEDGDRLPRDVPAVVRVRSTKHLPATLDRIAHDTTAAGVILRLAPSDLDRVLDEVLPAARRRAVVDDVRAGTLRQRLRLRVPREPDLTDHARAFAVAPNPGGRL